MSDNILSEINLPLEDPRFYAEVHRAVYQAGKNRRRLEVDQLFGKEYTKLSQQLDISFLQESCSVRNQLKTRRLARLLINDEGFLDKKTLEEALKAAKKFVYPLGPDRQYDAVRNEHILKSLQYLQDNPKIERQLLLITRPNMHKIAEQIIRDTLQLPQKTMITDVHARQAALAAWLCYLRQNVGSCFATAPAIIVQGEQPEVLLKDIQEMFATGRLRRVVEGEEYAVPISYSWGAGELRKIFLFSQNMNFDEPGIWSSPGLLRALVNVGAIDERLHLNDQFVVLKELIKAVLETWDAPGGWFYANAEQVLEKILLRYFELIKEDVEEFLLRPKGIVHDSLMMHVVKERGASAGKSDRCRQFLSAFEQAKNHFKSLSENALLKTWEFTLASFAETKAQFTKWNLYSSLGLKPEDAGGIGPRLYEVINRLLEECNEKVGRYQEEYEVLYNQLQYLRRRSRSVGSEKDAQWVRIEYQSKANEFYSIEALRDKWHMKARRYSQLYDVLIDWYYRLFPEYFQEVYDPDIQEVTSGPYDDSPAGFRLLYKYGRSNTSQWALIHNHTEFIDALVSFFTAAERELSASDEMKEFEGDLAEITTRIVTHIRSEEFLESAFHRMAHVHGAPIVRDPLKNMEKIQKKPWVYTSGGAITTLISCYFRLGEKPKDLSRWVENAMELMIFLIDCVKEAPQQVLDEVLAEENKSFLMHSPTHAFLLKPGFPDFREGWKSSDYTFSWVRDRYVKPAEDFVRSIYLDDEKMKFIVDELMEYVHPNIRPYFKQTFYAIGGSMSVQDFRYHMVDTIEVTRGLQIGGRGCISAQQIDSVLFSTLPLTPSYQLVKRVERIIERLVELTDEEKKQSISLCEQLSGKISAPKFVSAKGLQEIVRSLMMLVKLETTGSVNYPKLIAEIAQQEGFALPKPFVFADTNWVKNYFSFVVNPGNGNLELWRTDDLGIVGEPMSEWKGWIDGTRKKPDWGVFNRTYEYRLSLE
ncbi:putative uncharacterized protein [Waddlia chondrophila 2032/99]|uniref:Uncharacterized protein n=1 Tax=Waddlia chondrophila 2032/99 TaxID=765953 RepID=F8LBF3_9BACT|nr:putative uncharacterized protein [Waddlia chondrophila 2032/99]